jgi:hypothetical protein
VSGTMRGCGAAAAAAAAASGSETTSFSKIYLGER